MKYDWGREIHLRNRSITLRNYHMPKHCKVFYDGMSKDFSALQSKIFLLGDHKLKSRIKVLMLQTNRAERYWQESYVLFKCCDCFAKTFITMTKIVDTLCIVWSCTNLRFCDALVLQIMICKQINPILKSYLKVERETVTPVLLHWSEFCFTGDAIIAPTHTFFFWLYSLLCLPNQKMPLYPKHLCSFCTAPQAGLCVIKPQLSSPPA